MKYTFFLSLCLIALIALPAIAQDKDVANLRSKQQLAMQYDDVSVGRNINITYHRGLGRGWYLYGGFKYHINSKYYRNDWGRYTYFYKETYAANAAEHGGAKLGLEKTIWQPNRNIVFSAFYELQYTNATVDNKVLLWAWNQGQLYYEAEEDIYNLQSFENNIGMVVHAKISDHLLFRLQAGMGFSYFISRDGGKLDLSGDMRLPLPLSRMFGFGLEYNLNNTNATTTGNIRKKRRKEDTPLPSLTIGYDDLQTGRNFNIVYRRPVGNNTYLYGGLKLNMGSRFYSDYTLMGQNYYFKQFRPADISERFGIKAGAEYYIALPHSKAKLFGFYDFQLMRAMVKNLDTLHQFYSGISGNSTANGKEFEKIARPVYRPYGPVLAFENYLGAGLLLPFTDKLSFRIQGGIGVNYYLGPKNDDWGREWKADRIELSRMFGLGLQYNLRRK